MRAKRTVDIIVSLVGLFICSPIIIPVLIVVWLQDYRSPLYIAPRVGKNAVLFKMIKIRSMVINADRTGVDSTSANDMRITSIGKIVRKYKLDELTQLWNVLIGDMSLVGPRPNVIRDVDIYTNEERKLLSVRPGITDLSSIVFSDENYILQNYADPDIAYNQLIRPWKSRLGLIYIKSRSLYYDFILLLTTIIAIMSRSRALNIIAKILDDWKADEELKSVCRREISLNPCPPPGAREIVMHRQMHSFRHLSKL
jgi:lipopolysaccharide/colanic/teichoic acid biosynthesis glycosyltransferase